MAPISSTIALLGLVSSISALPFWGSRTEIRTSLPTLPALAGLPTPTGTLEVIALGVGHQNYTCNATTNTFSSNTALADLYDATKFFSSTPVAIPFLPSARLNQYNAMGADSLKADFLPYLQHIGTHYFQTASPSPIPNFNLSGVNLFLSSKKVISVPAPSSNAIAWLYLEANGSPLTKGLSSVYRVETAGGVPPTSCRAGDTAHVPYVAEYWFYA